MTHCRTFRSCWRQTSRLSASFPRTNSLASSTVSAEWQIRWRRSPPCAVRRKTTTSAAADSSAQTQSARRPLPETCRTSRTQFRSPSVLGCRSDVSRDISTPSPNRHLQHASDRRKGPPTVLANQWVAPIVFLQIPETSLSQSLTRWVCITVFHHTP
jgi:hypothetical protein